MRILRIFLSVLTWFLTLAVQAGEYESPSGNSYLASEKVLIDRPVQGCLYAAARDLRVVAAVVDNVHLAGRQVSVEGPLGRDLIAAAQELELSSGSSVAGDLIVCGKDVRVEGPVRGRVWLGGNDVVLDGPVGGKMVLRYDHSLVLGPGFHSKEKIICYGPQPPQVDPKAFAPDLDYRQKESIAVGFSRLSRWKEVFGLPALVRLAAWLLAAWSLNFFFPKGIAGFWKRVRSNPLGNLGLGFVLFVLGTIGVLLLLLTWVGWYMSLLIGTALFTGLVLARLLVVFYLAFWSWHFVEKKKGKFPPFRWVAGSILLTHFLGAIPWVGCLSMAGLTLVNLGILARWGNGIRLGKR